MYAGRAAQNSKAAGSWIKTDGFAFLPANADFREGIVGAVELAREGDPNLASPHASS